MESLQNGALIPIIHEKELDVRSLILGFHEYRTIWTHEKEVLHVRMEPTNKKDKFAAALFVHKNSVVAHLMKEKSGRFAKTIFYFLRTSEDHGCRVRVTGKLSIKDKIKI